VFHTGITDSLYSSAWTPSSAAGYAGTWLFLFFLGIIARSLTAGKIALEQYWSSKFSAVTIVTNKHDKSEVISGARVVGFWRASVDVPRAFLQTIIAGVYYLL
jgi:solute carrier family 31 (copper transporter), member 1